MFLKVKRDLDDWIVFDNISNIRYSDLGYIYTEKPFKELNDNGTIVNEIVKEKVGYNLKSEDLHFDHMYLTQFHKWNFDMNPVYAYNIIRFENDRSQENSVVFDTVAYICNNDGKTIEKIVGGSGY